jgi:mycothiol synthase
MGELRDGGSGALEFVENGQVVASATVESGDTYDDLRIKVVDSVRRVAAFESILPAVRRRATAREGRPLRWWVTGPDPDTDEVADRAGLTTRRDLCQLRRPLPLDDVARAGHAALPTRSIRLGGPDEEAVVAINNRAFEWHPDQADRTVEWLRDAAGEPWFDAGGFLVHETDGRVDGFCWTKVHDDPVQPLGEIYVIAVDPDAHGRGLGRGLTVAGLDHLAGRDLDVAMLYVEALNVPALALYHRLGFVRHELERAYQTVAS